MQRILLGLFTAALLLQNTGRASAADEPRALVARALEAAGGEARLAQVKATHVKVKGILHEVDGAAFTGEILTQLPDRFKFMLQADTNGLRLILTYALDRDKAWTRHDEDVEAAGPDDLRDFQESAYVDYVASLVPLVQDRSYQLSPVPDIQVKGQAAAGVLVKAKGKPDVKLYFAKDSGLLVKTEHRRMEPMTKKEGLYEEILSDYREVSPIAAEEQVLKTAKMSGEPADLLDFIRKQTLDDAKRDKIKAVIRQLGDANFQVREKAKEELVAQGKAVTPLLSQAAEDPDAEIAKRAKLCLDEIGKAPDPVVSTAVIRLLGYRKPDGTAAALLAYLPSAPNAAVAREVEAALLTLAQDGKPDPAPVQALEDKNALRRAAAAAALKRDGKSDQEWPGRRLYLTGLKRPMKGVQLHNGAKTVEWEVIEVQLFNKLDDKVLRGREPEGQPTQRSLPIVAIVQA